MSGYNPGASPATVGGSAAPARSSTSSEAKAPQNEACQSCRSVKRRCHHETDSKNNKLTCTRCDKLGLECKYGQQKRGRKSNASLQAAREAQAAQAAAAVTQAQAGTSIANGSIPLMTRDKHDDLMLADGEVEHKTRKKQKTVKKSASMKQDDGHAARTAVAAGPAESDWLQEMLREQTDSIHHPVAALPAMHQQQQHVNAGPSALPQPRQVPVKRPSQHDSSSSQHHGPLSTASAASPVTPFAPQQTASPGSLELNGHPNSGGGGGRSPAAPQQAVPGGFSLNKLLASRHPSGPARHSLADAFAVDGDQSTSAPRQERTFKDLVSAGLCPLEKVTEMFDFYYAHLNPMTSLLDPTLHTAYFCRTRSAFLFSAILTATSKVMYPAIYVDAIRFLNSLFGQAFEHGVHNLELVQALALAAFWADATDDTGARKVAFAIRSAFELGCHKRAKRPLPEDDFEARMIMARERTWMYLTIADHRFSTQRSLPRMIPSEFRYDPIQWIISTENQRHRCPSDAGLAPLIGLGRLLDLYLALVNPENGDVPNRQLLDCLETDCAHWITLWCEPRAPTAPIILMPSQASLIRFYAKLFRFQLDEVHLLISIKSPPQADQTYFDPRQSPVLTFNRCVKSALRVLESLQDELNVLVILYDSIHIGAASAAVWLVQNINGMDVRDRMSVIKNLNDSRQKTLEKATDAQSMAAVTAKLFDHLLYKARPAVEGVDSSSVQVHQPALGQPVRASSNVVDAATSSNNNRINNSNNSGAVGTALSGNGLNSDSTSGFDSTSWGALGDLASMGPSLLMSNYFPDLTQPGSFFGGAAAAGGGGVGMPGGPSGGNGGAGAMAGTSGDLSLTADDTWARLFPYFTNPGF
ncbi:hypothetical protein ACM66B_000029 [Microbotryomycetes sp. NB124-2]